MWFEVICCEWVKSHNSFQSIAIFLFLKQFFLYPTFSKGILIFTFILIFIFTFSFNDVPQGIMPVSQFHITQYFHCTDCQISSGWSPSFRLSTSLEGLLVMEITIETLRNTLCIHCECRLYSNTFYHYVIPFFYCKFFPLQTPSMLCLPQ